MTSDNETFFTISSKQPLIPHQTPPKPPITKTKSKKRIFLASIISLIIILVAGSIISISISKTKKPDPPLLDPNLDRFYCHLTTYPDLCYESISSIITNTTLLQSNPSPIFFASIRVAIDQINATSISISESLNASLIGPSLTTQCGKWAVDSVSRLNESLTLLGAESYIESLTYSELDDVMARVVAARDALKCVSAIGGGDQVGVEEVKMGVERAKKIVVNSIDLLRSREDILDDFYGRLVVVPYKDDYYNYYFDYYYYDYRFLICLYSGLYLFLGLLYLLFWRSK